MTMIITDDCINCGTCEVECPASAVYSKTNPELKEILIISNIKAHSGFISDMHYYINPYECNECTGFFKSPRCNTVCPVACCLEEDLIYDCKAVKAKNSLLFINKISLN